MAINGRNIVIGTMNGSTFTPLVAVKSQEVQTQADTIEKASASQQQWREFIAGRKEWSVNVSYLVLQDANSNVEDLLKVGNTYAIRIKGRTGTYYIGGSAICTQCKQTYQVGNISVGSYGFKGTGALSGH